MNGKDLIGVKSDIKGYILYQILKIDFRISVNTEPPVSILIHVHCTSLKSDPQSRKTLLALKGEKGQKALEHFSGIYLEHFTV